MNNNIVKDFLNFLNTSTTPYQTVIECERRLVEAGFTRLYMEEAWYIQPGGKYYIIPYDSVVAAFKVAEGTYNAKGFKIIASHNDSPCFKIKPNPEMKEGNVLKLNTEVYGGPILNTWMDRLLSIAGKVSLKSNNIFKPKIEYIDFKKPLLTIPNLAIHLNRKVNEGLELNKQIDLLPILSIINKEEDINNFLVKLISKGLGAEPEDVLDFDLFAYLAEEGKTIGVNEELISAPRLDNLAMVYASFQALINCENNQEINMAVCFNHEEIGSTSIEGADSSLFSIITKRIITSFNKTIGQYYRMLNSSFLISADAAHAVNPNRTEKADPTNEVFMNNGIVIKNSARKSYTTDCEASAIFIQLCNKANIKFQRFANRSDNTGGSTLGPIITKQLPIKAIDVGVPMWAMHSSKEVIGVQDFIDTLKVFEAFYKAKL